MPLPTRHQQLSMGKNKKTKINKTKQDNPPSFSSTNYSDTENGLYLINTYIPEEIVLHILSFVDPEQLLQYSLICRKWNKLIKSYSMWSTIYERKFGQKAKKLPWYLYYCLLSTKYFNTNLLLNGNGQDGLDHWECKAWEGDKYVEAIPLGVDPLPDIPEFNEKTSCFVTSYFTGTKAQSINFGQNKLLQYILNKYRPHIYLSEWTTANIDCSTIYELECGFMGDDHFKGIVPKPIATHFKPKGEDSKWKKVELLVMEYPEKIEGIIFKNSGYNTQPWKGHYGIKMAGGVVRLLFDSIKPLSIDKYGNVEAKQFSKIEFISGEEPQVEVSDYFAEDGRWNEEFDDEIYYFMP